MFWRFGGYANISTIDTILDKPDFTLEEVLDESDLIQELKQHNSKLIEYLRDESVLQRLLAYVIAPPLFTAEEEFDDEEASDDEDDEETPRKTFSPMRNLSSVRSDSQKSKSREQEEREEREEREKTRQKYAYVASEILSSETWSIIESLMENQPFLRQFWEFIRKESPLDPATAGYFTKINETLLDKKTEETLDFIKGLPGIVSAMLKHVDCPMILDLLLKIISMEKSEGGQGIVDWLQSQELMPSLLAFLHEDHPTFTQTSAGDFIKAIITISANASQNEQSCIGPNSLTRQLVSEPCIDSLINNMLKGGNPLTVGVGIIIEVIRKNNSDYDPEVQTGQDYPPSTSDPIYLGTLLRRFAKHVPDFMELILSPNHTILQGDSSVSVKRKSLLVASGKSIEPLGFDRFKTCELMAELLHCSNMGLLNEKGSEAYIQQRDKERERLRSEGSLAKTREPQSAITEFSEDGSSFDTDAHESLSPSSSRRLEVTNSADDDGFEDVGRSEDIPNEGKTVQETSRDNSNQPHTVKKASSRLSLDDEFFDEPLESPKKTGDAATVGSPTSAVASQVRALDIKDDGKSSESSDSTDDLVSEIESQLQPDTSGNKKDDNLLKPGDAHDGALSTSPLSMSPNLNDTPAPLFSPRTDDQQTNTEETGSEGEVVTEASEQQIQEGPEAQGEVSIPFVPYLEDDIDGRPIVGDYLKRQFVEHRVVPTILDFFFRFPWNNFLHNVVYDVVQQIFNGPMDRGFNRNLAFDLFQTGLITERIIQGQQRSDQEQARTHTRLGYMGHLTLLAEEVVKFSERYPSEVLSEVVVERVTAQAWSEYVEVTLNETRERDNAILGGVKPDAAMGPRAAVLNAVNAAQGFSNSGSAALANAGLNGGGGAGLDSMDLSNNPGFLSGGSLLSGFGSSSDEEDEEMEEMGGDADGGHEAKSNLSSLSVFSPNPATGMEATQGEGHSGTAPVPQPLSIPPSRARRQLAARLAMQQAKKSQGQLDADSAAQIEGGDENVGGESSSASATTPSSTSSSNPKMIPAPSPLDALLAAAGRDHPSIAAEAALRHADSSADKTDPWAHLDQRSHSSGVGEGFEDSFTTGRPVLDPAWEPRSLSRPKRDSGSADWVDFGGSSSSSSDDDDGNEVEETEWTPPRQTKEEMGWDTPPQSDSTATDVKLTPERDSTGSSDGDVDGEDVPLSISMSPHTQLGSKGHARGGSASGTTAGAAGGARRAGSGSGFAAPQSLAGRVSQLLAGHGAGSDTGTGSGRSSDAEISSDDEQSAKAKK